MRKTAAMPTLIACLSSGKGTWSEVHKLIQSQHWSKVFLITNDFGKEKFSWNATVKPILINSFQETPLIVEQIRKQLQGQIIDFEVALNLASGSGNEHMAVVEAILELGLNFRLITIKNSQVESLGIKR